MPKLGEPRTSLSIGGKAGASPRGRCGLRHDGHVIKKYIARPVLARLLTPRQLSQTAGGCNEAPASQPVAPSSFDGQVIN
jgi:hypothetical protein